MLTKVEMVVFVETLRTEEEDLSQKVLREIYGEPEQDDINFEATITEAYVNTERIQTMYKSTTNPDWTVILNDGSIIFISDKSAQKIKRIIT